jgi:hypothetical protein
MVTRTDSVIVQRFGATTAVGAFLDWFGLSSDEPARAPREDWLWANAEALRAVRLGLAQSARGEFVDRGSFAADAELDIDD